MARVSAVCVVHAMLPEPTNPDGVTAIDKRPVLGTVEVGPLGLVGDRQADSAHHGGQDKALYLYADADAQWWAEHLGRDIPPGLFGENLRAADLDVSAARIGQRWSIGESGLVVEVTMPRTPCATFARRMAEPHWVRRFAERRAPGAYLRVVTPGTVAVGDVMHAHEAPAHGITLADVSSPARDGALVALLEAERDGRVTLAEGMRRAALRGAARD